MFPALHPIDATQAVPDQTGPDQTGPDQTGPDGAHLVARLTLGAADGPRVVVKDVIDIAGFPTCAGSPSLADAAAATRHADVVQALLDGGARIVGKANMHELAFGVTGVNDWTGTPTNPFYPEFVPGGSSSGSATAVAAGLAEFAVGTDTGGSIRVPAACCGVVGLKPTYGRLSRAGLTPATSSLDCVGPLAADMAWLVRAMAILEPGFSPPALAAAPRVGLVATDASADMSDAVSAALREAGAEVRAVELPGLQSAFDAGMVIMNAEMFEAFAHLLATNRLGADIALRLQRASSIDAAARDAAEAVRARFTAELDRLLETVDALALPTLPDGPVPLRAGGDAAAALAMTRLVRPFNLTGHPAIALPLRPLAGVPASLQLVGRKGDDAALCAIAAFIEARAPSVLTAHAADPQGADA